MNALVGYRCSMCQKEYLPGQVVYTCPNDGGNLDVVLDYDYINNHFEISDISSREELNQWRYLPLLPVEDPQATGTPLGSVGWTPMYSLPGIKEKLGLKSFWLKDEGKNPSASLKDRASAVVVARARQVGAETVVTASTGNAGAALACMAAAIGMKAVIFAPKTAPQAKIAQLLIFGAKVILVDGNYDDAFDLSIQAAREFDWYCRNTGYNPFTVEGKKTAAFEIWEQLMVESEEVPGVTNIFVSVGDGNIISGLHKGFKDLQALGWLKQMPRLYGIQSEKSAAIANAFENNTENILPVKATTIADSISVDLPRDGVRAARAAVQTRGAYLKVSDEEILQAIAELGREAVFCEPAGACAFAGMKKALTEGMISPEDSIVVLNTGSGLKDIKAAMSVVEAPPIIEPSLDALKAYL